MSPGRTARDWRQFLPLVRSTLPFGGTGSIWELNVLGFVLAVIAAVLLVGAAGSLAGKKTSA